MQAEEFEILTNTILEMAKFWDCDIFADQNYVNPPWKSPEGASVTALVDDEVTSLLVNNTWFNVD